jgi:hypothetical protein
MGLSRRTPLDDDTEQPATARIRNTLNGRAVRTPISSRPSRQACAARAGPSRSPHGAPDQWTRCVGGPRGATSGDLWSRLVQLGALQASPGRPGAHRECMARSPRRCSLLVSGCSLDRPPRLAGAGNGRPMPFRHGALETDHGEFVRLSTARAVIGDQPAAAYADDHFSLPGKSEDRNSTSTPGCLGAPQHPRAQHHSPLLDFL